MSDFFVRMVPLPWEVYGVTAPNDDGTYSIYINSRRPEWEQKLTLEHELAHIKYDDLYSNDPVVLQELRAERERKKGK